MLIYIEGLAVDLPISSDLIANFIVLHPSTNERNLDKESSEESIELHDGCDGSKPRS